MSVNSADGAIDIVQFIEDYKAMLIANGMNVESITVVSVTPIGRRKLQTGTATYLGYRIVTSIILKQSSKIPPSVNNANLLNDLTKKVM